jgi:8-oxo-dGTP pyrophosphatase MutT (NUDIX family)
MASRDGNGWVTCTLGHQHWGRFGAAGLLAYAGGPDEVRVLLQHRCWWSHHGGTWGLPGGAADSHESPVAAALREAAEECAVPVGALVVRGVYADIHGGWTYHTIFASAAAPFEAYPASDETDDVTWAAVHGVADLELHPGFAAHWAELAGALAPLTVIVDAANVVGSRPDGWWRDRVGAARRLVTELAALAGQGMTDVPAELGLPAPARWFPDIVVVLEGQARGAAPAGTPPAGAAGAAALGGEGRLSVVSADGSGDDAIARLAGELPGRRIVVTADRELKARCAAAGAVLAGPRWLTGQPGGAQGGQAGERRGDLDRDERADERGGAR